MACATCSQSFLVHPARARPRVPIEDATSVKAVAERLRVTRDGLGMTQALFAGLASISPQAYNNYERGRQRPELDKAIALVRAHKLTLDWIYLGNRAGCPIPWPWRLQSFAKGHAELAASRFSSVVRAETPNTVRRGPALMAAFSRLDATTLRTCRISTPQGRQLNSVCRPATIGHGEPRRKVCVPGSSWHGQAHPWPCRPPFCRAPRGKRRALATSLAAPPRCQSCAPVVP